MANYTTIDDPTAYFQTKIFTGNENTLAVTFDGNTDMQPDWVWIKNRADNYNHSLFDSVRGATKRIASNATLAEATVAATLTAFNSNGFTLGNDTTSNAPNNSHVSWNWKKSATAGFDIVAYTGTGSSNAVSHSLSATPNMMIIKNRDDTDSWYVWHQSLGAVATNYITLDTNGAKSSVDNGIIALSSSNFTVNTRGDVNASSEKYIAYCFAEKQGYSKFGSYKGNGNVSGPYIHLGFSPAFVMWKRTDTTNNWMMGDNKQTPFNPQDNMMRADLNNAQLSTNPVDFLSNGFKIRLSGNAFNNSSGTYIYMAFAEQPFVTSTGVPATAR